MKTATYFARLLFCAALLFACNSGENKTRQQERASTAHKISFKAHAIHKTVGNCEENACAKINIEFNQATDGPQKALEAINRFFLDSIVESLNSISDTDVRATNIQGAIEKFVSSFQRFKTQFPEAPGGWEFNVNGTPVFQNDSLVSLSLKIMTYTGGAHPNTSTSLITLHQNSGKKVELDEVAGDMEVFTNSAEKKFRRRFNLAPGDDLDEEGFFFENGDFSLPENWCVNDKGILLHYNQYEAASYAEGPIEIQMPRKESTPLS